MLIANAKTKDLLKNIFGDGSVNIGNYNYDKNQSEGYKYSGSCYMGLYTDMPDNDGAGGQEVAGNHYSRVRIGGASNLAPGEARLMSTNYKSFSRKEDTATDHSRRIGNVDEISFPEALNPADEDAETGGDWGNIVGFGLFTDKTGGAPYAWGRVNTYTLTAAQPDDWAEKYTSYYTRSGEAGSYVYTRVPSGEAAPAWAASTYYGRYIPVKTHNKLLFRVGHFEIYMDQDEDPVEAK